MKSQIWVSLLLILAIAPTATAGDANPGFKFTTKRDNDRADVKVEKDKVIFSISPTDHHPLG